VHLLCLPDTEWIKTVVVSERVRFNVIRFMSHDLLGQTSYFSITYRKKSPAKIYIKHRFKEAV
jgi:hypothetical protein